jgi:cytochrome c biogenesis protein CcdA
MNPNRIEPVVLLLFVGMLVFTGILLFVEKFYPNDGQMFQVIAGLLTAFSGAFFMRVKPKAADDGGKSSATITTDGGTVATAETGEIK